MSVSYEACSFALSPYQLSLKMSYDGGDRRHVAIFWLVMVLLLRRNA